MNSHPTAVDLVSAVARWLAAPDDGARAFGTRVARNALDIVVRELQLAPAAERRGIVRMAALTGIRGSFGELEARLCDMIRSGELDYTDAALLAHLRATARDRLAIDQPKYRHGLGESE